MERVFQKNLICDIKKTFPGCIVLKNDPNYICGIPDLLVLYKDKWAALECKKNINSKKRPHQEHYVDLMNEMSFSRFVHSGNREEVLRELQQTFQS